MSKAARVRLWAAVAVAFCCGLVFASGFNLTSLSWAQVARPEFASAKLTPPPSAKTADAFSNTFEWVANTVKPAVVSITAETQPQRNSRRQQDVPQNLPPGFEQFFRQFRSPQQDQPTEASGTGFIVSKNGYILTNNHVVADNGDLATKLTVKLLDNRVFTAKLIGRDPTTDVALIKIDATNLPTVEFGDDTNTEVGQWVLAIGNPLGLNFTVTAGIVSAKNRQLDGLLNTADNPYAIMDYIQTDAAINPGNSGGPLVNLQGQVIGINSALASGTGYYAGYGFAIPISLARHVMDDFINYGHVRRAVLGVTIREAQPSDAAIVGLDSIHGAVVGDFTKIGDDPSPSEQAGMERGDVIVSVNGQSVHDVASLQRMIRDYAPGQTITVGVKRRGHVSKTVRIKLAAPPLTPATQAAARDNSGAAESGDATAETTLGITVSPASQDADDSIPAAYAKGLLVTDVSTDSPAYGGSSDASSVLAPSSDIIVKSLYPTTMDIKSVDDLTKAVKAVKNGGYLQLLVYNIGSKQTRTVNIEIQR